MSNHTHKRLAGAGALVCALLFFCLVALPAHSQSGRQFFRIHVSNHGRVMVFAGGIPLIRGWENAKRRGNERRFRRAESRRRGSWSQSILNS